MQAYGQHFWTAGSFGVEDVEGVFEVLVELSAGIEPGNGRKSHVIGVQGVGHYQVIDAVYFDPVREIVGVRI